MMHLLSRLVGKTTIVVASSLACGAGLIWHIVHLDLLYRPGALIFLYIGAWATIWLGLLLYTFFPSHLVQNVAKGLLTVVGIWLIWQTIVFHAPGPTGALTTMLDYSGRKISEKAEGAVQETPAEIICNKTTYQRMTFFAKDTTTGKRVPKVWYSERQSTIVCFNHDGYDPLYGDQLLSVTETIIRRIAQQEPPQIITAAPATPPAQIPLWGPEQPITVVDGSDQ